MLTRSTNTFIIIFIITLRIALIHITMPNICQFLQKLKFSFPYRFSSHHLNSITPILLIVSSKWLLFHTLFSPFPYIQIFLSFILPLIMWESISIADTQETWQVPWSVLHKIIWLKGKISFVSYPPIFIFLIKTFSLAFIKQTPLQLCYSHVLDCDLKTILYKPPNYLPLPR